MELLVDALGEGEMKLVLESYSSIPSKDPTTASLPRASKSSLGAFCEGVEAAARIRKD